MLGVLTFSNIDELQEGLHSLPYFSSRWYATWNILHLYLYLSLSHTVSLSLSFSLCWTDPCVFLWCLFRQALLLSEFFFIVRNTEGGRQGVQSLKNTAFPKAFVFKIKLQCWFWNRCVEVKLDSLNYFQLHLHWRRKILIKHYLFRVGLLL